MIPCKSLSECKECKTCKEHLPIHGYVTSYLAALKLHIKTLEERMDIMDNKTLTDYVKEEYNSYALSINTHIHTWITYLIQRGRTYVRLRRRK